MNKKQNQIQECISQDLSVNEQGLKDSCTKFENFQGKANNDTFFLRGVNLYLKKYLYELPIFEINIASQLLFIIIREKIKIFCFFSINRQLKILFLINLKNQRILLSFKNKLKFISAGQSREINICQFHQSKSWIFQKNNLNLKLCFLHISQQEDFLISGSEDGIIKFWQIKDAWYCFQSINLKLQKQGGSLIYSVNDTESKLIILHCSAKKIFILEKNNANWILLQEMNGNHVNSICFATSNMFVASTHIGAVEVNEWQQKIQKFQSTKQFQLQGRNEFEMRYRIFYIQGKKLLFIPRGKIFNVFQLNEDEQFNLIYQFYLQSIYFSNVKITENGNYLISGYKRIFIKKLKLL